MKGCLLSLYDHFLPHMVDRSGTLEHKNLDLFQLESGKNAFNDSHCQHDILCVMKHGCKYTNHFNVAGFVKEWFDPLHSKLAVLYSPVCILEFVFYQSNLGRKSEIRDTYIDSRKSVVTNLWGYLCCDKFIKQYWLNDNLVLNNFTYIEFVSLHNLWWRVVNVVMGLVILIPLKTL